MHCTVKDLKRYLETVPDDAVLVRGGNDHTYVVMSMPDLTTGLWDDESDIMTEDHGEDITPEKEYGRRVPVLFF